MQKTKAKLGSTTTTRPDTASSCRSVSTATSKSSAPIMDDAGRKIARSAGLPSDDALQRKLASLEAQVENERSARRKMEKEVRQLRSEVGSSRPSSSSTSRSRVTSIA